MRRSTTPPAVLLLLAVVLWVTCDGAVPTVKLNNGIEMPLVSLGVWKYNDSVAHSVCTAAHKVGDFAGGRAAGNNQYN